MTGVADYLSELLDAARAPGDVVEPTQLLDVLRPEEKALLSVSDPARAEQFFAAFSGQFGFFPMGQRGEPPLNLQQRARWTGLFRWLFAELADWSAASDPNTQKLTAIFVAAQSVRAGYLIWASMPSRIAENVQLISFLKAIIKSTAMEFGARGGAVEPIWEREAVEGFKVADKNGDWAEIGQSMHLFEHQLFRIGAALGQSVRILAQCGLTHLVEAVAPVRQSLIAMQLAIILPRNVSLSLAATSENPCIQFACVYQAVTRGGNSQQLSSDEQGSLFSTLLKVAAEGERWIAWMKVFNTYPVRYPLLQATLGITLATAPEAALHAYVEVISLNPWPAESGHGHGREVIADCLRSFQAAAPLERRQTLWQLAYQRWTSWDFGRQDVNQNLFAINWSDLDYAIVAFASECLDEAQRSQELEKINLQLQDLDLQWFASITDLKTAWNRVLCRFQPFAHASEAINNGADWLCETKTYLPFDPATQPYIQAKFAS